MSSQQEDERAEEMFKAWDAGEEGDEKEDALDYFCAEYLTFALRDHITRAMIAQRNKLDKEKARVFELANEVERLDNVVEDKNSELATMQDRLNEAEDRLKE